MGSALPLNTPTRASRDFGVAAAADDDIALLNYLVSVGRVDEPDGDAWHDELLGLVGQARRNLARSAGTFVMGETYVRLFRVTRDDVVAAAGVASRHRTGGADQPQDPPTVPHIPLVLRAMPQPDFTPRSSIPRGRMPSAADLAPLPSEIRAAAPRGPKVRAKPTPLSRVVLAAASVLLAAAVATVLIAAWTPESEPRTLTVAQTHTREPLPALPTTSPTANPQDVALARRPASTYVAPAPKTTVRATPDNTRRAGTQTKRQHTTPKRRTIPNPIPGFPPIVLP